ncbi:MAG TPA: condensation domain-containing protein [Longimicrobium sp.]|nr:condensation domain-containing protein [Longimicrobium sp.]
MSVGQASAGPAVLSLEEKRRLLVQKLQAGGEHDSFPLSFAQQRLWVVHQMDPAGTAYNMPYALRLRGALDAQVLGRALTALVRRHETLRTVFPARGGVPVQRILPPAPVDLRETDLRAVPPGERDAEAARMAADEAAKPFDLATGPLLRVSLLRLADEDALVLFTLHHIVSDGWSQNVLIRDLSELYAALSEGRPANLPALPIRYADYAVWQRGRLSGEVLDEQLRFWRERLAGAPPVLALPTDRPRRSPPGARADRHDLVLSAETTDGLRVLARDEGASLFMTLLAVFQALLARWSGEEDVVVGTPVAGRSRLEVENLIGFFLNLLPLRTDLSGDPTVRELVARVREGVLQAIAHEELPFEKLVDELHLERTPGGTPLFQVLFELNASGAPAVRLGTLRVEATVEGEEQAKYDLSLRMHDGGGPLAGALIYRTELFDASTIDRMAGQLARMLEQAAAAPDTRLSALKLMDAEERRTVVETWNGTAAEYPADRCVHQLFEAQAARTPGAPAVTFGEASLTYAELDRQANRLAHHLRRLGVGPEVRVGLCLERRVELMVAILGVLKAGGAYVPAESRST